MSVELKDSQVSVRLPNDLKEKMETYAQLTGRTKSYVAMEALSSYLDWRLPQIEDLKAAVLAADRGEFASNDEVAAVLTKSARKKVPRSPAKSTVRRRAK
jgi:RHH-type transcriptional regulator, rel operon repressor / antitoxin RelB